MDHGGCGLLVGVKDNRIVHVKGDPDGFLNKGYICPKGSASPDKLVHPSRLKHPLKRTGKRGEGQWERISWREALERVSWNLQDIKSNYGARAMAFCQGMPKGLEHFVLIRLANLFGSPNVVAVQDVCHAPREVSGLHTCGFYPVSDFHYSSRLIVLWGSNITSTNEEGGICSQLLEQVRQGTDLMVVDPRRTALTKKARYWLQIKPGTDHALAMAFLNVIVKEALYDSYFVRDWCHGFDELADGVKDCTPEAMSKITGVPAPLIEDAARFYANAHPAAIGWGNPIEQNVHAFHSARALICLMAICGNLDINGGNIQANEPDILGLAKFVRADLIPKKRFEMIHAHYGAIPKLMTVPASYLKKAILEEKPYPVKGAYLQCTNPLLGYADSRQTFEALLKLDFLAVSEVFMTPTAALADIVLPAATNFEFNDIGHYGLGHGHILARPKIVDPPGECWPDIKILNELGKRITAETHWYENYEDLLEAVLEPAGLDYHQFAERGYLKGDEKFKKYTKKGFKTATGKVELMLSRAVKFDLPPLPELNGLPEADDPEYPLILTSRKSPYYLHSSYRWLEVLRKRSPGPVIDIHPETAARAGIKENDQVLIETRSGAITQIAHLTDRIAPEVVFAAYGWWFPEEKAEEQFEWRRSNYNILTRSDRLGKEFGTPNLKGIRCRIRLP